MSSNTSDAAPPVVAGKKIIVVGAGIAGLSFALALRKQWPTSTKHEPPSVTIYERDTKETSIGREGYSLSIRSDGLSGGMQALHRLNLLERMLRASISVAGNGSFNLWNTAWQSILSVRISRGDSGLSSDKELPADGMRIARDVLRRIMVDAVYEQKDTTMHWERPCTRVEPLPDGKIRVHLGDGTTDECDILIAADGASSKIRTQLRPADGLSFTGAVCISATSRFDSHEAVPRPVDRDWGAVLGGGGVGLFVSPVDSRSALWSVSYLTDQPRERMRYPLSEEQVQSLLTEALERGSQFSEPFQTLVRATDPTTLMLFNAMDKQPFKHERAISTTSASPGSPSIIFIGDSNHAMSPFAGNGANMALLDGWELAEQLCRPGPLDAALRAYDAKSVPRSKAAIRSSRWTISMLHATGWKLFLYTLLFRVVMAFMRWRR
ncbi:hypothetical protein M432DRAFT_311876 [Thermoascus aurantiacus ATCC 26904]